MPRLMFVTGRLAESALRQQVEQLSSQEGFATEISVLGISVAALMHVGWVARKLTVPPDVDRVILPGWCQGDLRVLENQFGKPFERGPKDLLDLPEYFGQAKKPKPDLSHYDIEILAEINHAPRMSDHDLLRLANHFRDSGANVIDLGCIPSESWSRVGDVTRILRAEGFRVSIDSFDRREVEIAVAAGAELVLSVNQSNIAWARHLPAELIAIPDDCQHWEGLEATVRELTEVGAKFRIDPILEPIGYGFAASLARYQRARSQWPNAAIMMGIGNLTELTEVDSSGINLLLASFCQELEIHSVLTTEVIPWCQSAIREFDIARRIAAYSIRQRVLPKRIDSRMVMLRDSRVHPLGPTALEQLTKQIRDPNFRLFAEGGELHAINRDGHRHDIDPFRLFQQMGVTDPEHAFYLGYELAKAKTALTLGKQYTQDEALNWGFLTEPEQSGRHESAQEASLDENAM